MSRRSPHPKRRCRPRRFASHRAFRPSTIPQACFRISVIMISVAVGKENVTGRQAMVQEMKESNKALTQDLQAQQTVPLSSKKRVMNEVYIGGVITSSIAATVAFSVYEFWRLLDSFYLSCKFQIALRLHFSTSEPFRIDMSCLSIMTPPSIRA